MHEVGQEEGLSVAQVRRPDSHKTVSGFKRMVRGVSAAVLLTITGAATYYDSSTSTPQNPGFIQTGVNLKEGLISGEVERLIVAEAKAQGVEPNLVKALAWTESHLNPYAVSSANSHGVMQLNARYFKLNDYYDPKENIHVGVKELARLTKKYRLEIALAAYNAGERNVAKANGKIPDIEETQNYVKRVLERKAWLDAINL